jgi:ankyrin repeat protein
MKAAEEDKGEILRLLHAKNVDIEASNRRGRTALSFAAAPSMNRPTATEALRILLEEINADQNKKCERGLTPKDYAKDEKRDDALAIFEQCGRR